MVVGSFLGDDDYEEGSTYGLEGLTGRATDVAGGKFLSTMGSQHWCAVVEYTKVRCQVAGRASTVGARARTYAPTHPRIRFIGVATYACACTADMLDPSFSSVQRVLEYMGQVIPISDPPSRSPPPPPTPRHHIRDEGRVLG